MPPRSIVAVMASTAGASASSASRSGPGEASSSPFQRIPRILWLLWFDGWSNAPELHGRCLESWELYNLGWEIRQISRADLPKLLGDFRPLYERLRVAMNPLEQFGGLWIPPAAESDLLRLILLTLYGGIWVDATMLCRRPLDEWLPEAAASGFFAFSPEDEAEQLPIMSSFLAAEPGNKIVVTWLRRVIEHWSKPSSSRPDMGYFWVHKLFGQMVGDPIVGQWSEGYVDEEAKLSWAAVPRVSGEYGRRGPHFWVKYSEKLPAPPTREQLAAIEEDRETPMWKMTNHEVKLDTIQPEAAYWVLLEATRRQARSHIPRLPEELTDSWRRAVLQRLLATGSAVGCH